MTKKLEDRIFVDDRGHIHKDWFQVDQTFQGSIIMCPEGCVRMLQKNGKIYQWNKGKKNWEEINK